MSTPSVCRGISWRCCSTGSSTILLQSAVPEHAELSVLLGMLVTVPRLERNPTYKEQVQQLDLAGRASLGLLAYPVLQAADILIYQANTVPVGEDQLPHLELARELARRFNKLYGDLFVEPQPMLSSTPRLPGTDGRTMHTSYGNTIALAATPEEIRRAVWGMVTDPARIHAGDAGHPEICALNDYHQAFEKTGNGSSPEGSAQAVAEACRRGEIGCVEHKRILTDLLVQRLEPFRRIRQDIAGREEELWDILRQGSQRARPVARATLARVRERMGLPDLGLPPAAVGGGRRAFDLAGKLCC